jgi:hypothetical protein
MELRKRFFDTAKLTILKQIRNEVGLPPCSVEEIIKKLSASEIKIGDTALKHLKSSESAQSEKIKLFKCNNDVNLSLSNFIVASKLQGCFRLHKLATACLAINEIWCNHNPNSGTFYTELSIEAFIEEEFESEDWKLVFICNEDHECVLDIYPLNKPGPHTSTHVYSKSDYLIF